MFIYSDIFFNFGFKYLTYLCIRMIPMRPNYQKLKKIAPN